MNISCGMLCMHVIQTAQAYSYLYPKRETAFCMFGLAIKGLERGEWET